MKIDLPFEIGGPLWWADVRSEGEGPALAEIKHEPHGIDAVKITADGPLIVSGQNEDAPGTGYACLSRKDCRAWIAENHPGAVLLSPGTEIKAVYSDERGRRSVVTLDASISGIEVFFPNPVSTAPDAAGTMAICKRDARSDGDAAMTCLEDARGNTVGAIFGPFLLVRVSTPDGTGLRKLDSIGEDVTRWILGEERRPDGPARYAPSAWASCEDMTVEDLCAYLQGRFPKGARMHVCGTDKFWLHYAPDNGAVSLDCEDLSSLEEYAGSEPRPVKGSAKA